MIQIYQTYQVWYQQTLQTLLLFQELQQVKTTISTGQLQMVQTQKIYNLQI